MGLAETLGARAARQGRSAPVTCGELGTVMVEALPVRELELLLRGSDGARAVFYAACRELQSAGEALRNSGKVFAPDGIMQFVSDGEAEAAARTVLELSGWTEKNNVYRLLNGEQTKSGSAVNIISLPDENRLQIVQEKMGEEEPKTPVQAGANRLGSVQNIGPVVPLTDGNRLAPVQFNGTLDPSFGQVSRETETKTEGFVTVPESDKKSQAMGILPSERAQNVVSGESTPIGADDTGEAPGDTLHESTSEFVDGLHEIKSEFRSKTPETVHETTSDFQKALHEIKSDFGEIRRGNPHEIKSEFGEAVHEMTSEFGGGVHETTSELRNGLHETESELAEKIARRLLEGLRRAKWVRGD